ncbi:UTP--glucose-1-phosphate uridylyltransferase GalU [Paenibacillus elgii]|uniref:UTP--glucose-1-phosphate uridylyltransferase GalU n=1 Tax=Paenibacillus elgii TaxID=189691 RepID=UPI002D7BD979|nr:UTP--glucose-1-phosphate uridylyltransferase GalU [Paenibacillus elgii]
MRIRKAIIPAAGLGTRFLPATKAMPKEMLPIVDTPTIQYIIEEAVASGIEDIIIVTGKGKRAIEDHFDMSFELESSLIKKNKLELLDKVRYPSKIAEIHYIRQKEARGLGHAIWCARKFIGNEPFAVLLGDDIIRSEEPALKQLISVYNECQSTTIGVQQVDKKEVHRYGIVDGELLKNDLYRVSNLIEKPAIEDSPSNLAIIGRYVLTPDIFYILENQKEGIGGEIQLTDALLELAKKDAIYSYIIKGSRYDVGEKLGFIEATVEFALNRPDLRYELIPYLKKVLHNLSL